MNAHLVRLKTEIRLLLSVLMSDRLVVAAAVLTILWCAVAAILADASPQMRSALTTEDQFQENVSVGLCMFAFVTGTAAMMVGKRRFQCWLVPLIALLAGLSEMSFGERLFALEMPVIHGMKLDAIHDVFEVLDESIVSILGRWPTLFLEAAILMMILWATVWLGMMNWITRQLIEKAPYRLAMLGCGLIASAVVLDMFIATRFTAVIEESLECMGAFCMCWAAALMLSDVGLSSGAAAPASPVVAPASV